MFIRLSQDQDQDQLDVHVEWVKGNIFLYILLATLFWLLFTGTPRNWRYIPVLYYLIKGGSFKQGSLNNSFKTYNFDGHNYRRRCFK